MAGDYADSETKGHHTLSGTIFAYKLKSTEPACFGVTSSAHILSAFILAYILSAFILAFAHPSRRYPHFLLAVGVLKASGAVTINRFPLVRIPSKRREFIHTQAIGFGKSGVAFRAKYKEMDVAVLSPISNEANASGSSRRPSSHFASNLNIVRFAHVSTCFLFLDVFETLGILSHGEIFALLFIRRKIGRLAPFRYQGRGSASTEK